MVYPYYLIHYSEKLISFEEQETVNNYNDFLEKALSIYGISFELKHDKEYLIQVVENTLGFNRSDLEFKWLFSHYWLNKDPSMKALGNRMIQAYDIPLYFKNKTENNDA